jgi:L-amino acid N-acyltransferase YncA
MRFDTPFGAHEIESMPSQPQVAICHGFFVPQAYRGKGRAHDLKRHQIDTLTALWYDFAICTVAASNEAQRSVLEKAGWAKLAEFENSKTGEMTELWGYEL